MNRNLLGSNQYKAKRRLLKKNTWISIIICLEIIIITSVIGNSIQVRNKAIDVLAKPEIKLALYHPQQYVEPPLAPANEVNAMKALIAKVWGKDAFVGLAISRCESGYNEQATNHNTNGTIDEGLFQVNSVHQMPDMLNATANALYAHQMYQEQGLAPWLSSQSCWRKDI